MIVVVDTGPLNYLLLIEQVEVLPALFSGIVVPQAVAVELKSAHAPEVCSLLDRKTTVLARHSA